MRSIAFTVVLLGGLVACGTADSGAAPGVAGRDAKAPDASSDGAAETPDAQQAARDTGIPLVVESGLQCNDPDDWGGTDSPFSLKAIKDDSKVSFTQQGVLSGPDDIDRFLVFVDDVKSGLFPKPYVEITSGAADQKLCVYMDCASKAFDKEPQCPAASVAAVDPESKGKFLGCCFTSTASAQTMRIKYDCDTADDDVSLIMDISSKSAMCTKYTFQYKAGD